MNMTAADKAYLKEHDPALLELACQQPGNAVSVKITAKLRYLHEVAGREVPRLLEENARLKARIEELQPVGEPVVAHGEPVEMGLAPSTTEDVEIVLDEEG